MCMRFVLKRGGEMRSPKSLLTAPVGTKFVYDEARPLDGIIAHLTRRCGGHVHKKGVVTVTASSVCRGPPENVVDLTSDSELCTLDKPNRGSATTSGGGA